MSTGSKTGSPSRWLIFSYFSNIDGKASSQHLDDRIPHFLLSGIKPILISSICGKRRPEVPNPRVPSMAPSGIRFELRYLRRRNKTLRLALFPILLLILPLYLLEKLLINLESEWSWFLLAFLCGLHKCRKHHSELIYSTGGPASAHLAAGLLARFTKTPWIAELQDPIVFKDWVRSKTALRLHSRLERFILENAAGIVFLTREAKDRAVNRTGADPAKCHVIYPGSAPLCMPRSRYSKGTTCHFAHFGSLGGSRNLETFLDALKIVISKNSDLAEILRLDLYGTMDRHSQVIISNFEYPEIIRDFGKLPRSEALCTMQKSDFLLLVQNRDELSHETIPSKVYEYFQAGRPIIGLIHQNPELAGMLAALDHCAVEADSPFNIASAVEERVDSWRKGIFAEGRTSLYTIEAAVDRLRAISGQLALSPAIERMSPSPHSGKGKP